ncbi:MAG TPA: bifunctional homocysteine S-methyltransferase/methylenetetrahydrofolate reductase [Actinomycetota bacterium]|nr:bifunctional homocysteine S-methyltransferase/methylenetetrahydrofolate reductase [Actinomycetota bacterium]
MDRKSFSELLKAEPILGDGGTGTSLVEGGVRIPSTFDALNLTAPDAVVALHRSFIDAGARFIETNTFGANRYKLADSAGRVAEINAAGVTLARRSGAEIVVGSVGPLGVRLVPYGRVRADEAAEAFREQISALAEAGADVLFLETQTDVDEAQQAVLAARSVCDLPVIVSFAFTRDDHTLLGETPETVARRMSELDVDALGVNCSEGPAQVLRLLRVIRRAQPDLALAAMPNAGQPHRLGDRLLYQASPKYMADYAVRFFESGVSIIGGCCGTGPEHIRAMGQALAGITSRSAPAPIPDHEPVGRAALGLRVEPAPAAVLGAFGNALGEKSKVYVVEMAPPRSASAARLVAAADTLAKAGVTAVSVADSPMARMRMSPWAACHLIQQEADIATVLHFPTRGRNLLRIQGDLLASHALGIRNVFVCMGDPTSIGDYPQAADHADVTPSGLIGLIKGKLNMGIDRTGASIGEATEFVVGCSVNLDAPDLDRETKVLRRKITAGADFAYSQPLFSPAPLERFRLRYEDRYGALELPILVGLLPIVSARHAEFLHNEVPGINVPEEVLHRMAAARSGAEEDGLGLALETGRQLHDLSAGLYLIPPFGRYHLAAELIEQFRSFEEPSGRVESAGSGK